MSTLTAADWNERYAPTEKVWGTWVVYRRPRWVRGQAGSPGNYLAHAGLAAVMDGQSQVELVEHGWVPLLFVEPLATDDQRREAGWLDPDQAAELTAERDRLGDQLNETVQLAKDLREELHRLKGSRILSVVFGHHKGAPRPFALRRTVDETGVSGTGIVATGCEFDDGVVAMRWRSDWPTSVVFHDRGIEAVEAVHGHGGKTEIVWLSDELTSLAEMEQRAEAAEAQAAELRADRHEFDESSVLNPATGKPYPIVWGEDNQPDPLCRCGALWSDSDGGCLSVVEELRRERERLAAWRPVIDAARALVARKDELSGSNRADPNWWSDNAWAQQIALIRAVDTLAEEGTQPS